MAENKKKDEALQKNLALLKKRALNVKFELDTTEYKPIENIGIGAYGVVCSAIHLKSNDRVAIKKIPGVFDYKDIAKRTYREIKILKHFTHDNVIRIREILKPKESFDDFKDIYVVFDLMESDLHKIIYSKQELTEEHVRYFLYQILRGLKYIHSAGVIHRDLKPSNLLVNEDCQLRIGDFGMARGVASSPMEPNYFMTQYVATRWYRAPEIMLSLIEYGAAVDMWSVGCIFAEMLGRKHLFPGKDSISQIKLIVGLIGTPKENLLQLCQSPIIKNFIKEMGNKEPVPLQKLYPKASKKALNLLSRMLVLHPKERITVEQALVHPYLNKYHDPDDEPICVPMFNFDFEKEDFLIPQLRDSINTEIMEYHKPRTPTFSFNAFLRPVPKSSDSDLSMKTSPFPSSEIAREVTVKEESTSFSSDKKTCSQQIDVSKSNEDDVFKRPLSAQNKVSPVHVNTDNVLKVDSDIEMLSAKSTDGKLPMSAQPTVVKEDKTKENKDPVKEEKNKTISEDTKNLIKAALRNESFKKRTDSVGDDERPRPVTAAMRQKEREDKRKKKKEKSKERKRKEKKKQNGKDEILTSEDKELLQRWTKMQTTNVPIAPKPPDPASIATAQGQVQSKMAEGQNEKDGMPKLNLPSFPTNQRNVQQGTLNLLQQRLLANASTETASSKQSIPSDFVQNMPSTAQTIAASVHDGSATSHCSTDISTASQPQHTRQVFASQPSIHIEPPEPGLDQNSPNFAVDFSHVNLGDLDFLSMLSSPEVTNILTQNVETDSRITTATSHSKPFDHNNGHIPDGRLSGNLSSEEHGAYLQHLCSGPSPISNRRISDEVHQPQQLSVSPNYPDHVSPPQFFQGHSPGSQHSLSPGHQSGHDLSPSHNIPIGAPYGSPNNPTSEASHIFNPQLIPTHTANIPSQQTNIDMNSINAGNLFLSSSLRHSGILNQSNQGIVNQSNVGIVNQSHPGMMTQSNQAFMYRNQSGTQEAHSSSNSNSNSPPALSVNIQEASLTMQQLFQGPVAGPSGTSGNILDTHVDLVALLSKQLSKSNVEDLCPQLALTPRGTGGGYGVGVDLDALMIAQEAEGSQAAEPSPLSSSILADWMEVTGNMNIDMEALEQELQSPMALSYNDLNLYSS